MTLSTPTMKMIHIADVESDPLRSIGFRALLESEADFNLIAVALPEILMQENIDVVLLWDHPGRNLVSRMANLKAMRPDLPIIVIGASRDDEAIFGALAAGAKGYVFDGSQACEFAQA